MFDGGGRGGGGGGKGFRPDPTVSHLLLTESERERARGGERDDKIGSQVLPGFG